MGSERSLIGGLPLQTGRSAVGEYQTDLNSRTYIGVAHLNRDAEGEINPARQVRLEGVASLC